MNYIVLDLEWNQPNSPRVMVKSPVSLKGEIIQIGAVKLDENLEIIDTFKIMVKPKYYRTMHKKVSRLTSITDDDLQYGFPFKQALSYFNSWCTDDCIFLTWSGDDVRMLRSNLLMHKVKYYSIPKSYDVQKLFSIQIAKDQRQYSLVQALEIVQEPACSAHDALHDAINTTRVLRHLTPDNGQVYGAPRIGDQIQTDDGMQEVCDISFDTRGEAFAALEKHAWICPDCGDRITFGPWVRQNYDKKIAITTCCCGQDYFARIRIRKSDDRYRCNRIVYPLTDDLHSFYNEHGGHVVAQAVRHVQRKANMAQASACL